MHDKIYYYVASYGIAFVLLTVMSFPIMSLKDLLLIFGFSFIAPIVSMLLNRSFKKYDDIWKNE